jgi:nitrite reductase (NO-forming)
MDNKIIWIVLIIVVLLVLAFAFWGNSVVTPVLPPVGTTTSTTTSTTTPNATTTATSEKIFTVTGANFAFAPATLTVNRGDRVRIVFVNNQGLHDWVLDEFNVRTPQINTGQQAEVSFVADRTGIFEYYCSIGNHRAMGMVGKLIVN